MWKMKWHEKILAKLGIFYDIELDMKTKKIIGFSISIHGLVFVFHKFYNWKIKIYTFKQIKELIK